MSDEQEATDCVTAVWSRPQIDVSLQGCRVLITVTEPESGLRLSVESVSFDAAFAPAVIKALQELTRPPHSKKPSWQAPL